MINFSSRLQELRSNIIGLVLLMGATLIGFVWISIGLNQLLSARLGTVWGPIVLGLIYFVPITVYAFTKAFIRSPAQSAASQYDSSDATTSNIMAVLENLSGRSPFVVASAAVVAGFLATRFPSLLSAFTQLLVAYAEDAKAKASKEAAPQEPSAK